MSYTYKWLSAHPRFWPVTSKHPWAFTQNTIVVINSTHTTKQHHTKTHCPMSSTKSAKGDKHAHPRAQPLTRSWLNLPMLALRRAGASLTPSPVTATTQPARLHPSTIRSFCVGEVLAIGIGKLCQHNFEDKRLQAIRAGKVWTGNETK